MTFNATCCYFWVNFFLFLFLHFFCVKLFQGPPGLHFACQLCASLTIFCRRLPPEAEAEGSANPGGDDI